MNATTIILVMLAAIGLCVSTSGAEQANQPTEKARRISDILRLLRKTGHEPVVLRGDNARRIVVVTPSLVGRVLCTGFEGIDGATDSYILEEQIRKGFTKSQPGGQWAVFGGEERVWLAPEHGKYGFFSPPGKPQTAENYTVPEPMNSTRFQPIDVAADGKRVSFAADMSLVNCAGTPIDVKITREVAVAEYCPYTQGVSDQVEFVGFASTTYVQNTGRKPWSKETGAVSIWTLGQFTAREHSVVIMPYRAGSVEDLGPPVSTEYFRIETIDGKPTDTKYWSVRDDVVLLKASGVVSTKLELMARRSLGRIASIDLKRHSMCILEFDSYPELEYVASYPLPYAGDAYRGGAASSYVLSDQWGIAPFYELECCSPALFLQPGEKHGHRTRTYRLRGNKEALFKICKRHFHVDANTLSEFDRRSSEEGESSRN